MTSTLTMENRDTVGNPHGGPATPTGGELLDAALAYARRGWPVVPLHNPEAGGRCSCGMSTCTSVGKHPRTPRGFHDATTDEARIREWWGRWPQANIGIATGDGLVVIDVDKAGIEAFDDLIREHGALPETVEALTGGGGRHLYFRSTDPSIRNSASKLAPGVDVRANGGYIVAPPSLHRSGRRYTWEASSQPDDVPVAPLPGWLRDKLVERKPERERPTTGGVGTTIPEGQRNSTLASLGGKMRYAWMGEDEIAAALLSINERRCDPSLEEQEVRRIAGSVARYEPGTAPSSEGVLPPTSVRAGDETNGMAPRFRFLTFDEVLMLPPPEWLVQDILPRDSLAVLTSPPASYKSFLAGDLALSVAAGIPWLGIPVTQGATFYIAAEGRGGLAKRNKAWRIARGVDSPPCTFLPEAVNLLDDDAVTALVAELGRLPEPPALIVIDTLARSMVGGDENATKDMGRFIAACDQLRVATGACVLLLHHVTKGNGTIRGSSALLGAVDTHLELKREDETATLSCAKQKDAEEFKEIWLARRKVELGNGETSIVLDLDGQGAAVPRGAYPTVFPNHQKALKALERLGGSATATEWQKESGIASSTFHPIRDELCKLGSVKPPLKKGQKGARYFLANNAPPPGPETIAMPFDSHVAPTSAPRE